MRLKTPKQGLRLRPVPAFVANRIDSVRLPGYQNSEAQWTISTREAPIHANALRPPSGPHSLSTGKLDLTRHRFRRTAASKFHSHASVSPSFHRLLKGLKHLFGLFGETFRNHDTRNAFRHLCSVVANGHIARTSSRDAHVRLFSSSHIVSIAQSRQAVRDDSMRKDRHQILARSEAHPDAAPCEQNFVKVFAKQPALIESNGEQPDKKRAIIALGSNIGDRIGTIESSCRLIEESGDMKMLESSPLYETKPMYVEDQELFLNGVCMIETQMSPMKLLDKLQAIENGLGRVKTIDKGPRNIDLDIVTYDDEVVNTERLSIPHKLMLEREFVLRPFCDTSARNFKHPQTALTAAEHLQRLPPSDPPMYPLTPLAPGCDPIRALDPQRKTLVMSILNVTPDSFSDGGVNQPTEFQVLKATVATHIAQGATIIDIGGQSSRPNAADITAEEEIARILPAIEAIKSLPEADHVAISIDTYRASVAEAAIGAGAHIINDISAGLLDAAMLPTIARLGCTYIMMHMRGTPATMQDAHHTSYPKGLLPTITAELHERLRAAEEAGIRRWRVVLDPGLGFAKTVEQNLEILHRFAELRHADPLLRTFPWLVGSSRKGFIGKITGEPRASDRLMGTAATVTAAIQGGAEIVRVHDVKEMAQVVAMADAMYRSGG